MAAGEEELLCLCRKPYGGELMVGCEGGCDMWFHPACIGMALPSDPAAQLQALEAPYTCAACLGAAGPPQPDEPEEWVQCEEDGCGKWRTLPAHVKASKLPDRFVCSMAHWLPGTPS
jgi:hypothetical protein